MIQFVRDIPYKGKYDVVVCGSGPGGFSAALTLSRLGYKVLIVEAMGCIGGYATSAMMGILLDLYGKGGIPLELYKKLESLGKANMVDDKSYTYDIESMKYVMEGMLLDAGVNIVLYSRITSVNKQDDRITHILIDGPEAFSVSADWFIDGTGSGQIGFLSGCTFDEGSEIDSTIVQPSSLQALVTHVPEDKWNSNIHNREVKQKFRSLIENAGHVPSYPLPLLFKLVFNEETCAFQINHEYNVLCSDSFAISNATLHARREIFETERDLKKIEGWERLNLVATADQIGMRDGRRIRGLYKLTSDDGAEGKCFEDGVVPCSFCFDIHAINKKTADTTIETIVDKRIHPYEIPLRSMISRDVKNLFMVGRAISGDFEIHSSYRVMGPAMGTGEAVGLAISIADKNKGNEYIDGSKVKMMMKNRKYKLS